jgi:hypothetical protein
VRWQTELVVDLFRLGSLEDGPDRNRVLNEALGILERLEKEHKLTPVQIAWPNLIRGMLNGSRPEPNPAE